MESLGLAAMITGLSPLRGCTVQIPEHADNARNCQRISKMTFFQSRTQLNTTVLT